jgi:hypothetical protein
VAFVHEIRSLLITQSLITGKIATTVVVAAAAAVDTMTDMSMTGVDLLSVAMEDVVVVPVVAVLAPGAETPPRTWTASNQS